LAPRFLPDHFLREWDHLDSRRVDHVIGAFLLMRGGLFRELGGFDERFFVYLEDLDLSVRINRLGKKVWYLADCSAHHVGGGCSRNIKATRLFYSLCSHLIYARKHFRPLTGFLPVLLVTVLAEPLVRLLWAVARLNVAEAGQTVVAYAKLWCALPTMFRIRRA
jgi:GT2 family glycosyltransferase